MHTLLKQGHSDSVEPWARLWSDGHGAVWRADAEYAERHHRLLLDAVLDDAWALCDVADEGPSVRRSGAATHLPGDSSGQERTSGLSKACHSRTRSAYW